MKGSRFIKFLGKKNTRFRHIDWHTQYVNGNKILDYCLLIIVVFWWEAPFPVHIHDCASILFILIFHTTILDENFPIMNHSSILSSFFSQSCRNMLALNVDVVSSWGILQLNPWGVARGEPNAPQQPEFPPRSPTISGYLCRRPLYWVFMQTTPILGIYADGPYWVFMQTAPILGINADPYIWASMQTPILCGVCCVV